METREENSSSRQKAVFGFQIHEVDHGMIKESCIESNHQHTLVCDRVCGMDPICFNPCVAFHKASLQGLKNQKFEIDALQEHFVHFL
jgi:hypothetical protein